MSSRPSTTRGGWRAWAWTAWVVFTKELVDALRDRRTLMVVVASSVLMGPLLLTALSQLIGGLERQAEVRELLVDGIEHAPSLRNYMERQTLAVRNAPADYEDRIQRGKLGDVVLVIPPDFETRLAHNQALNVEVMMSSADTRGQAVLPRALRVMQGFNSERAGLQLAARGVSPLLLQAVTVQPRDLANPAARGARFTGMIPLFVLLAVMYGTLAAALDTTAGERERGSLEPLLTAPVTRNSLVLGKWAAVTCVSLLIAVLCVMSFLPAQWLLRSETIQAAFRFGLGEAALLLALLLPLAAAVAATMMAVAIRSKTFKEAQTNASLIVLAVSLLPLSLQLNPSGDQPWHLAVPALGQVVLMNRILKAEAISSGELAVAVLVCALVVVLAVGSLARSLRSAALR